MKFTEKLYIETKENHKIVDRHNFVNLIRTNAIAAKLYINFNKICIYRVQKCLVLKNRDLQNKLFRDNLGENPYFYMNKYMTESLQDLLLLCEEFPLELEYMFKGGLIMGGNLLKKYVSNEDHDFLSFENPKELFGQLKNYLDENVSGQDTFHQENFIKIVNKAYDLITKCFDRFEVMVSRT